MVIRANEYIGCTAVSWKGCSKWPETTRPNPLRPSSRRGAPNLTSRAHPPTKRTAADSTEPRHPPSHSAQTPRPTRSTSNPPSTCSPSPRSSPPPIGTRNGWPCNRRVARPTTPPTGTPALTPSPPAPNPALTRDVSSSWRISGPGKPCSIWDAAPGRLPCRLGLPATRWLPPTSRAACLAACRKRLSRPMSTRSSPCS